MDENVQSALLKLLDYCASENWAGYEPYEVLKSRLFEVPLLNSRLPRLVFTQALKRSPINVRSLLMVPKTQNPKALGLFLSGFVKLASIGVATEQGYIGQMIDSLIGLRSQGVDSWCWGYNFPWQTRTVLVPRWSPRICLHVVSPLMACWTLTSITTGLEAAAEMAASSAKYLLDTLYWSDGKSVAGFGYPLPEVHNQVHNANPIRVPPSVVPRL